MTGQGNIRREPGPRLTAYVLLAEPAWIEASIASYYPYVRRIVACYDRKGIGWSGTPIPVDECIERLRTVDPEGKVDLLPGEFSDPSSPMDADTHQRNVALQRAAEGADWVLQLDTDEILGDPETFFEVLRRPVEPSFRVFLYPNRVFRQALGGGKYVEECTRLWLPLPDTLPLAVRPGVSLTRAREARGKAYRVGLRWRRPLARPSRRPHLTVASSAALLHMSWVRSDLEMEEKVSAWSHSQDRDWAPVVDRWRDLRQHPWRAMAMTPISMTPFVGRVRVVSLPTLAGAEGISGDRDQDG